MKVTDLLSTGEAAELLGVKSPMVRKLIREGRLPAKQIGRDYVLIRQDVESMPRRKRGRPAAKK